jgi:DNA-binding beta-propeller fold protein YncE
MIPRLIVRLFFATLAVASLANSSQLSAADSPRVAVADRNAPHPAVSIGHRENINAAFLSPDGAKIFTVDLTQLRVWDVASRKELALLNVRKEPTYTDWQILFIPEKKWLFSADDSSFSITNYETLAHVTGGSLYSSIDVVWDGKRERFYSLVAGGGITEIIERDGIWTSTPQMSLAYQDGQAPHAVKMILLPDGRLLIDLKKGHAIVDPVTWTEIARVDDQRRFESGPAGTLFAISTHEDKIKPVIVEKISASDLSTLATLALPAGVYVYSCDANGFDPGTNTLCLSLGGRLVVVDFQTMALREEISVGTLVPKGPSIYRIVFNPISKEWFLTSGNRLHVVDIQARRHVAALGDEVFQPRVLATKPKSFEFLVGDEQQNVKRIRLTSAGLQVTDANLAASALFYTPEGDIAFGSKGNSEISVSESPKFPKIDYKLPSSGSGVSGPSHIGASADGSLLVVRGFNALSVISTTDGKVVFETKLPHLHVPREKGTVAISPDNRHLVAYVGDRTIVAFDLTKKKQIWTTGTAYGDRSGFFFLSAEIFACVSRGAIEYRSMDNGGIMLTANIYSYSMERPLVCAISHDQKRLALYDGAYVQVFDAETGEKLMEQGSFAHVTALEFLGESRYIVTACEDSLLRIVDVDQRRELCSLALFTQSPDWVASAPDFRFDATPNAIDRMYIVNGAIITPLESLFDKLYTPKLLAGLFTGGSADAVEKPKVNFSELSPPPSVRLEFSEQARNLVVEDDLPPNTVDRDTVQVHAIAQASQSRLRELRLFQNGKIVSTAGLSGNSGKKSFELKLVPGENVFRAVAANQEGTESRTSEIVITYRPKAATVVAGSSAPQPSGLQLHLLVVGVNTYKNPKYNLNYAVADATAVKEKIETQTRSIFTGVNVKFIVNDQALKSSIAAAFKELTAKAGPRDVFVFYYAGHGVMTSDAKPEFFLVPHDVTQLYGADDALRQKGLSSAELYEFAKLMPAQKQLFILDACQSAGALTTVAMRGAAEEKAIAQLARSTGTHWLTASGSEQFATEFAQLGHGAFTYALLEGLAGRADTGDGRVTVNELKAFLESEVPEITQKHKGTPQYPSSYGFGQDFPVSVYR